MAIYDTRKKQVESGKSSVFNNWHKHTGVSMEVFLDELKWLYEDPKPNGKLTRELGIKKDGTLVRLIRKYYETGEFAGFYDNTGHVWTGGTCISAADPI